MNLNNLDIKIRPRTNWEAFDLGRSLLAKHKKAVYPAWIVANLILVLIFSPLFLYSPGLTIILYVFFIPVAERMVIVVLSRAVFGEVLNWKEALKLWPSQVKAGLFSYYFLYRMLPFRCLIAPVWQLERLKGKVLFKRLRDVSLGVSACAGWIGLFFSILELLVALAIFYYALLFIPEEVVDWDAVVTDLFVVGPPDWLLISFTTVYVLAIICIRPIWLAGGFTLYLHRRMVLEGWDIELQFRSLAARIAKAIIILALGLSLSQPSSLRAEEKPHEIIDRIMKRKEFDQEKEVSGRRFKNQHKDGDHQISSALSSLLRWLLISLIILFIAGLIYAVVKNVRVNKIVVTKKDKPQKSIRNIMGLDISTEALPDDIPGEALRLINSGALRLGLALLYKGSLHKLINSYKVGLKSHFTENDCLKALSSTPVPDRVTSYFTELTSIWLLLAYAHVRPDNSQAVSLCQKWQTTFALQEKAPENE